MSNIIAPSVLIEQYTPSFVNMVTESFDNETTGLKETYLKGVYMQADIKNRNGRIYPLHEMTRAVANANETIKEMGGIYGELDHPKNLEIALSRCSHAITELTMNGSNVNGKAILLDTPMGQIAKALNKSGVKYGVSSRGSGDVGKDGIVENFQLLTIDIVCTPSAMGAVPQSVYEQLEQYKKSNEVIKLAETVSHDSDAQKYFAKEIQKFIRNQLFK